MRKKLHNVVALFFFLNRKMRKVYVLISAPVYNSAPLYLFSIL